MWITPDARRYRRFLRSKSEFLHHLTEALSRVLGDDRSRKNARSGALPSRHHGKPVDPVKLSPDARHQYYERKAKEEAAARAQASRQKQAAERTYQATFGRASKYDTPVEKGPEGSGKPATEPAGTPAAADDPSLAGKLPNSRLRVDSDLTPPIGQQQDEAPSYK